jgi:hypothetical protein
MSESRDKLPEWLRAALADQKLCDELFAEREALHSFQVPLSLKATLFIRLLSAHCGVTPERALSALIERLVRDEASLRAVVKPVAAPPAQPKTAMIDLTRAGQIGNHNRAAFPQRAQVDEEPRD